MSIENKQDAAEPTPASSGSVAGRITAYLASGGLFNPELAIHDRVRDLLIDCREEIEQLRASLEWHKETLVEAEEVMCRKNLTDAEREAISFAFGVLSRQSETFLQGGFLSNARPYTEAAKALRGIWERAK